MLCHGAMSGRWLTPVLAALAVALAVIGMARPVAAKGSHDRVVSAPVLHGVALVCSDLGVAVECDTFRANETPKSLASTVVDTGVRRSCAEARPAEPASVSVVPFTRRWPTKSTRGPPDQR